MPDKTRFSLALILLFIAPSAWGQTPYQQDYHQDLPRCRAGWFIGSVGLNGYECQKAEDIPHVDTVTTNLGTFTAHPPTCEPGWTIVMQGDWGPKCAWVLKEPIYK